MTTTTQKIPSGYKQTEIGVIPADWDVKTFKDICWVNQGLQIAIEERLKNPTAKSKKYITIQYLNDGKETEYIDDYSPSVCCVKDDILMTRTGNTGIVISGVDGVFHNNFFKINFDKKQIEKDYFLYYLKDSKTKRIILEKAGTSTIPDLNHNDFYSIQIPLPPSKTERTAIASTLSDTDVLIEKLEKLLEKKKNIKQGVMQELLTGKLRLPGFGGKWETKKIGEIGKPYGGLSGKVKGDFGIGNSSYIPFMNIMSSPVIDLTYFDTVNIHPGEFQHKAQKGDLFFNGSSETPEEVGMCSVLLTEIPNLYLNSFCFGFRLSQDLKTDGLFFSYYFRSDVGRALIFSLAQGATRYNLSKTNFLKLEVPYPKPEEQIAIAKVFSDMDIEIKRLESQLTKYQNIKQGMMQTLLTGKIRLLTK